MKTEKPNNPFAFSYATPQGNGIVKQNGMTLRDYFANSAMQSYLSSQYNIGKDGELECSDINICNEAYRIADAMLKQREL